MTAPTVPHTRLAQDIAEVVTNEHIGPGYWRLRTEQRDLPAEVAQHLLAKGWREPLPTIRADDIDTAAALRILNAIDLTTALEAMDRDTLEAEAFDAIWEVRRLKAERAAT